MTYYLHNRSVGSQVEVQGVQASSELRTGLLGIVKEEDLALRMGYFFLRLRAAGVVPFLQDLLKPILFLNQHFCRLTIEQNQILFRVAWD